MGFGVLIAGLAITAFLVFKVIDLFPSPAATGLVGTPITTELDDEGLTLLVDDASFSVSCTVTDAAGAEVPLTQTSGNSTITINNHTWWVVLESTSPTPAGTYTALCDSADPGLGYALGERGSIGGFVGAIFGIVGTILVTVFLCIAFFVAGAFQTRKKRNQQFNPYPQAPGSYPSPGSYPPPGSYPNQPPPSGQNPYETYKEY